MRSSRSLWASAGLLLATVAQIAHAQNLCTGKTDNTVVCVDSKRFSICSNQAQTPAQSCAADTACCDGSCLNPTDPRCGSPLCKGVVEGGQVCVSSSSFAFCQSGSLSVQQPCAPGTLCCGNRCVVGTDPLCAATTTAAPVYTTTTLAPVVPTTTTIIAPVVTTTTVAPVITYTQVPIAPTTTVAPVYTTTTVAPVVPTTTVAPVVTTTTAVVAPPAVVIRPADCTGKADGVNICVSPTSFDRCIGQKPLNAVQPCATGTFCCGGSCAKLTDDACIATPPIGLTSSTVAPVAPTTTVAPVASTTVAAPVVPTTTSANAPVATTTAAPVVTAAPGAPSIGAPAFGSCLGAVDNSIVCVTSTNFNFCQRQALVSTPALTCAPGTVCCASTNRCDFATNCPVNTNPCTGKADSAQVCVSPIQFTLCSAQQPTPFQTCAPGTACCNNKCVTSTDPVCTGITVPQLPTGGVLPPSVTAPPPALVTAAPRTCSGVPDNGIVCTSQTTFNFCINQAFVIASSQSCPIGTICCADSNRCDYAGNCKAILPPPPSQPSITSASSIAGPTIVPGSCAGIPNSGLICTSYNSLGVCMNGALLASSQQYCAPGTVCCADTNLCDYASNCKVLLPTLTSSLPIYTAPPAAIGATSCAGLPDNTQLCTSASTFNYCYQGALLKTASQSCAPGTVCCADSNLCDFSRNCKSQLPPAGDCAGKRDQSTVCVSNTQFNFCVAGSIIRDAPQSCAPGTVCCADSGNCDFASNCKFQLPALPTAGPVPAPVVTSAPVAPLSCAGKADNSVICVSSTHFNFCVNQALISAPSQPCAGGTICCANTNTCEFSDKCGAVLPASCRGVMNGPVCVGPMSLNYCVNGAFVNAPPQSCPGGTVCCADTNQCDFPTKCGSVLPPTLGAPNPVPTTQPPQPTNTGIVGPLPTTPTAPVTTPGSCDGVKDNDIVCTSATTFNFCSNGAFYNAPSQSCGPGTVCCADRNVCDLPGNCRITLDSACKGKTDGTPLCLSRSTFNYCKSGVFVTDPTQSCPGGTVCCADSGRCDLEANCGSVLPRALAPAGVADSVEIAVVPQNVCANIVDNSIACINPNSYYICVDKKPASPAMPIAPGTKCCGNQLLNLYDTSCSSDVCSARPDNSIACTSSTSFTKCLNGISATAPEPCPSGTLCCGNACVAAGSGGCGTTSPPATTTISRPAPTAVPTTPLGSCENVPDYGSTCTNYYTFKYCLKGSVIPNQVDTLCGFTLTGKPMVCCPDGSSPSCKEQRYCKSLINVPIPEAPKPDEPPGICKGLEDDDQVCLDNTRFSICKAGVATLTSACGEDTVCCKKNGQCLTAKQCSGEAVEVVKPKDPCSFAVDGWDTCSENKMAVYTCKNKEIDITKDCPSGTSCCPFTRSCVKAEDCKDPCTGKVDNALICQDLFSFGICKDQKIAGALSCFSGSVCCKRTQACDEVKNC
ncbi:hypothetical protein HDU67_006617 [Dinochytrium kinnereticum]|nr:hypothetical protein HDU67_006617 [Dinochytrium kinnereticum]